jgi:hypothetical protein
MQDAGHSWKVIYALEKRWEQIVRDRDFMHQRLRHKKLALPPDWDPQNAPHILVPMSAAKLVIEIPQFHECVNNVVKVHFGKRVQSLPALKR